MVRDFSESSPCEQKTSVIQGVPRWGVIFLYRSIEMSPQKISDFMVINGLEVSIPLEFLTVPFRAVEISWRKMNV